MNEKLLELLGGDKERYPHSLERQFPHVLNRIMALWGTTELDGYVESLLIDDRGDRRGFPTWVASEIFQLSLLHAKQSLPRMPKKIDPWEASAPANKEVVEKDGYAYHQKTLLEAAETGDFEAANTLLRNGEDVDERDERSWTPLLVAAFNGHEKIALLLIEHGAAIDARDRSGYTALHWAAYNGKNEVLALLLSEKLDPNLRNNSGWTPLMQAATRGHAEVVKLLIDKGADVNLASNEGWTALIKAAANGHLAIVRLLLDKGAATAMRSKDGNSAQDLATKGGHDEIAALLARHLRT
ncbi:MAG: ankyrin repeat domain-containing protein [Nitrosomonadales bacterium]|nr:ankyrin repeat domain-containing protein [Nitrosomonadales bacterium]